MLLLKIQRMSLYQVQLYTRKDKDNAEDDYKTFLKNDIKYYRLGFLPLECQG